MNRALVIKELREIGWIVAIGLALYLLLISALMGINLLWLSALASQGGVPFVNDGFYAPFVVVGLGLALGLGFRQSLGDGFRGTWVYLLHRPTERRAIFATKMATGIASLIVISALPVVIYGWWAATPGTHASPFFWSMTADSWWAIACFSLAYLGAFFSGLRLARWFGTRLLPLAASLVLYLLATAVTATFLGYAVASIVLILVAALFVLTIQHTARLRDFG